jgi:hypothetical protein
MAVASRNTAAHHGRMELFERSTCDDPGIVVPLDLS